jgi:AcrR family transcriptional regulator
LIDSAKRTALLDAALVELGEKGYAGCTLEDALALSQVSPAEFDAEFADTDACLYAAYQQMRAGFLQRVRSQCANNEDWTDRVAVGLSLLLDEIAAKPLLARVATRVFPAIRPSAYRLYVEFLSDFEPLMTEGREHSDVDEELPEEVELLAIGAAESLIFSEIDAGRTERLPKMLPEILFSVLVPFIGPDRAAGRMRSAAAAR